MEEYDFMGQLIVVRSFNDVSYFLYGEDGEPTEYYAISPKDAERKIKESYEENGGFYDCMGDLYQF